MKRIWLSLIIVLFLSSYSFAGWEGAGFYQIGSGGTNVHYFDEKPGNPNITFISGLPDGAGGSTEAFAKAKAVAEAKANQRQSQNQKQAQTAVGVVDTSVYVEGNTYMAPEEKLQPVYLPAYNAPVMQGKDGIYTELLPIAGIKIFNPQTEKIATIIDSINGFPGWRTRLENLYPKLIDNRIEGDNVRYIIFYKDASTGGSLGTGVGGSAALGNAFDFGATATGGTGYSQATFNREFYILIVTVE